MEATQQIAVHSRSHVQPPHLGCPVRAMAFGLDDRGDTNRARNARACRRLCARGRPIRGASPIRTCPWSRGTRARVALRARRRSKHGAVVEARREPLI